MAAIDARRALALVGTPFVPQGRDPEHGLDCVGLCLAACRLRPDVVRADYRLRGDHQAEMEAALKTAFRKLTAGNARPGDLLLMRAAADQLHLGILTERGLVHADARLRRVVETPGPPQWPVIAAYRRRRKAGS